MTSQVSVRRLSGSLVILALAALAALATGSVRSAEAAPSAANGKVTIGLLTFQGDAFFQAFVNGARTEAKRAGVSLRLVNVNNDASKEASGVQDMISGGAKAILISPLSPTGSLAAVKSAVKAGVKVVCYNTCLTPAATRQYASASLATDHKALGVATGKAAAAYIKAKLGGTATIGILNCDVFEVCKLRKAGFKAQLKGLDVKYVADQTGFVIDKATTVAQNILTAHPDINVMWSANEGGTEGEVVAIKQSGAKAVVFGTDISALIAQELLDSDGILQATTGQAPAKMGALAVAAAVKATKGKKVVPFNVVTPNAFFSRANVPAIKAFLATQPK